ncbi:MAG: hypothetical protein A2Z04_09690 [Chloroflexi bacterium RBG_16_57_9]|nr:MAG: hypothetical protein A2Z04_09690 [Chloroflexi bacterium RBG_16_57_9]
MSGRSGAERTRSDYPFNLLTLIISGEFAGGALRLLGVRDCYPIKQLSLPTRDLTGTPIYDKIAL